MYYKSCKINILHVNFTYFEPVPDHEMKYAVIGAELVASGGFQLKQSVCVPSAVADRAATPESDATARGTKDTYQQSPNFNALKNLKICP